MSAITIDLPEYPRSVCVSCGSHNPVSAVACGVCGHTRLASVERGPLDVPQRSRELKSALLRSARDVAEWATRPHRHRASP